MGLLPDIAGKALDAVSRAFYAAAKSMPGQTPPLPEDFDINDILELDRPVVTAGVQQLVRDFGPFVAATDKYCEFVVGTGIRYQARVRLPKQPGEKRGKMFEELNRTLERGWAHFCREADITGQNHLGELMELAVRQICETGEALFLMRHDDDPRRFIPLALQSIEPHRLTGVGVQPQSGNEISQGIEYNKNTGKPVRYWFQSESFGNPVGVPAEDVIHIFKSLRPGQKRGISPFAPGVVSARMVARYLANELQGAELQSRYHAFVTAPDLFFFQQGRQDPRDKKGRLKKIVGGLIEYLQPGEKIEFANPTRPTNTFSPFIRTNLQTIAVALGLPFEFISGDYSGLTFSNLRAIRNDLLQSLLPKKAMIIRHFCSRVHDEFMDQVALKYSHLMPGYEQDPWSYRARKWIPPGMRSVNPIQEAKAAAERIRIGVASPQRIAAEEGNDWEEIREEIMQAFDSADRESAIIKGLFEKASKNAKTNPAALEAA